jgi:hypothetical protein
VLLLPYLERDGLYREFRLDEPWDGPHNKALLTRMPSCYTPALIGTPGAELGLTHYQVFVGPGTAFEREGLTEADFPDGLANRPSRSPRSAGCSASPFTSSATRYGGSPASARASAMAQPASSAARPTKPSSAPSSPATAARRSIYPGWSSGLSLPALTLAPTARGG